MNPKPLALIFSTVWPEPNSSAAGVRQLQWVQWFTDLNYRVVLASPSQLKQTGEVVVREAVKEASETSVMGEIELLPLPLNQSWVKEKLEELRPEIVLFDRFILEEQFGHFVYAACPNALVLLETQDLHLVRRARDLVRESFLNLTELPPQFYRTETALRETASILRVDHAVVVSSFEEKLLQDEFQIPISQVTWVPFSYEFPVYASQSLSFEDRKSFVWIGNFRHAPNIDGLRWFRKMIWPLIRKKLKQAEIKVYGAYPSQEVMEWNHPESGFRVMGPAPDLDKVFQRARVNLAPLRFGAGVKGKVLDGFRYRVPCVSTRVGSEGLLPLQSDESFPGLIANDEQHFAEACVELYENEKLWNDLSARAESLMKSSYGKDASRPFKARLLQLIEQKEKGSLPSWSSQILRHELMNSRKYFSKWIEEKESRLGSGEAEFQSGR